MQHPAFSSAAPAQEHADGGVSTTTALSQASRRQLTGLCHPAPPRNRHMSACSHQQPADALGCLLCASSAESCTPTAPLLPLQLDEFTNSREGNWLAQQGITPITWLGGGGCAQVYKWVPCTMLDC